MCGSAHCTCVVNRISIREGSAVLPLRQQCSVSVCSSGPTLHPPLRWSHPLEANLPERSQQRSCSLKSGLASGNSGRMQEEGHCSVPADPLFLSEFW